jgi:hypothetical protein
MTLLAAQALAILSVWGYHHEPNSIVGQQTSIDSVHSYRFPYTGKIWLFNSQHSLTGSEKVITIRYTAFGAANVALLLYTNGRAVWIQTNLPTGAASYSFSSNSLAKGKYKYVLIVNGRWVQKRTFVIS